MSAALWSASLRSCQTGFPSWYKIQINPDGKEPVYRVKLNNLCRCCLYVKECGVKGEEEEVVCDYFGNRESGVDCSELVANLKNGITPAGRKLLPRGKNKGWSSDDNTTPLYCYYRQMMNEALREVRAGRTAYLYCRDHLKDFLRYEPNVEVWCNDGIYYINKIVG